jgi:hypothetical protein
MDNTMETTISKMEAMADVIAHFPKYTEATKIYGNALIELMPEHDIKTVEHYSTSLDSYYIDVALTIMAANAISERMNGHSMFKVVEGKNKSNKSLLEYEGFDCWNRSCGIFSTKETLACSLIMIHGNLGMMDLTMNDGMVITNFKYTDKKFVQLLD